jgi:hypothetical protein
MPVNIAFAGGNGCRMMIRNKEPGLIILYVPLERQPDQEWCY